VILEAYAHRTCNSLARWHHDTWTDYTLCLMEMLVRLVIDDDNKRNASVCTFTLYSAVCQTCIYI